MQCKKVRSEVHLYLDNLLPEEEREPFLKHVRSCNDCYEELEISYIMLEGMRRLDNGGNIAVDFQKELGNQIHKELLHIHRSRTKRITFVILGALFSLFGIVLGYFEAANHAQQVMQQQMIERGSYYYYYSSKQYIFESTGYQPTSLKEIIYHGK